MCNFLCFVLTIVALIPPLGSIFFTFLPVLLLCFLPIIFFLLLLFLPLPILLLHLLSLLFHPFLLLSRDTGDILLKICNLMPQDTGIYTCVAVNDHGSASSSASIKVQGNTPGLKGAFYLDKAVTLVSTRQLIRCNGAVRF